MTMLGYQEVRPSSAPHVAQELLQHEAPDARAGVDRGQDEQRLEHDREVVPQRGERRRPARRDAGEDLRHADRERRRAAGAGEQRRFAHLGRERLHLLGRDDEPGRPRSPATPGANAAGARVDREVDAGIEGAGGDHRHHADERLHQHAAVADQAGVGLAGDHLGRGARRHQRVEAADRAAGDGDEGEREELAGEHRALARHRRTASPPAS